jgi:MFS transporter, FHS family, L-fucose permease
MSSPKTRSLTVLPVFLAFIVMGFVDIVGVSTGYIKNDFELTDRVAQLLPSMALIWFFVFSVPTGLLLDRFGKKAVLNTGIIITGVAMLIPFVQYSYPSMLIAFIFLGIGNTVVQVSINPLLHDVVPRDKFSSFMSLSQFIKAISSLLGPIIATFLAIRMGNWKLVFLVYAFTSFLSAIWLYFTKIEEDTLDHVPASFSSCFSLLKNRYILFLVVGIFLVVGSDVGMNSNIATYLQEQHDISLEKASLGISIYFTALMIGRFVGAVILRWVSSRKFLLLTSILALLGMLALLVSPTLMLTRIIIFIIGLGSANLFPLIFAIAVEKMPDRVNEISGLMIMAVAGGAFIPPVMGLVSSAFGIVPGFLVLVAVMIYMLGISLYVRKKG